MSELLLKEFCDRLETELCLNLKIVSEDPHNPVVVEHCPEPWECLGKGNYTAVIYHPDFPDWVVKAYAYNRNGFEAEVEVDQLRFSYRKCRRLGDRLSSNN